MLRIPGRHEMVWLMTWNRTLLFETVICCFCV